MNKNIKALTSIILLVLIILLGISMLFKKYDRCDVNRDGNVDAKDLLAIQKRLLENTNKYDVNSDGKTNAQDYVEIKNYIMSK